MNLTARTLLESHGFRPQPVEVLDSSMLKDFVDCPSYFYLRHILGLKKTYIDQKDSAKFDWGTCWHKVLEVFHHAEGSRQEKTIAALAALEENYPAYIVPEVDRYKRSKNRMIKAFFAYLEHWKALDEEDEVLRTEQYFNVYSAEEDLAWCGRIDGIRMKKSTGTLRAWDYKTSSQMGSNYFDQHETGFQFPGYVWASNLLSTERIQDITIDVLYMISKKVEFHRRTFRYIPERLKEWVENVKRYQDQIFRLQETALWDPSKWSKNWNECTRYGRCQFLDVHSIAPIGDTRLRILANDYHEDRWDPSDAALEADDGE